MHSRVTFLIITISLLITGNINRALAQSPDTNARVDYTFGDQITFHATVQPGAPISQATIFFQGANDPHTNVGQASVTPLGNGYYELVYTHPLAKYSLRAFSRIDYRFEAPLPDGKNFISNTYNFIYSDNRFDWKKLETDKITVHWYQGDLSFAQNVLDVSKSGLDQARSLLKQPELGPVDIYVYADGQAMDAALHPSTGNWVAGHADPDLGVIVAALPDGPEQRMLMEQRIPHELMHILLYQLTGYGYKNLPTWLNEGLASLAELYPNPDYRILLDTAIQKKSILPINSLCNTFPRDASNALLSYAEAASFTKYLRNTYGILGLNNLVIAYATGLDCEHGAKDALGVGLTQLEHDWRRDVLAENLTAAALENLLPWLVLLAVVLAVPILLMIRRDRPKAAGDSADQKSG